MTVVQVGTMTPAGGNRHYMNREPDLLESIIAFWQPRTQRQLSREDARQISQNITGFFSILARWNTDQGRGQDSQKATSF